MTSSPGFSFRLDAMFGLGFSDDGFNVMDSQVADRRWVIGFIDSAEHSGGTNQDDQAE